MGWGVERWGAIRVDSRRRKLSACQTASALFDLADSLTCARAMQIMESTSADIQKANRIQLNAAFALFSSHFNYGMEPRRALPCVCVCVSVCVCVWRVLVRVWICNVMKLYTTSKRRHTWPAQSCSRWLSGEKTRKGCLLNRLPCSPPPSSPRLPTNILIKGLN